MLRVIPGILFLLVVFCVLFSLHQTFASTMDTMKNTVEDYGNKLKELSMERHEKTGLVKNKIISEGSDWSSTSFIPLGNLMVPMTTNYSSSDSYLLEIDDHKFSLSKQEWDKINQNDKVKILFNGLYQILSIEVI